jgi:Rieske Fe-S protein
MQDVDEPKCSACRTVQQEGLDRRGVLGRLLGLVGGLLGISLVGGCPGGSTFGKKIFTGTTAGEAPPELSQLEWETTGLPDGIAAEFKVNGKPAYLLNTMIRGQKTFTAVLRRCPHSGCTVRYSFVTYKIECPCHGSQFDSEGNVLRGPAKKPLTRLTVRQEVGKVYVEVPGAYLGHGGVHDRFTGT